MPSSLEPSANSYNTIIGKVVLKETGIGIPDLLVVVLDFVPGSSLNTSAINLPVAGCRLGSVLTGDDGSFALNYEKNSFSAEGSKQNTNLFLLVLAPEDAESNDAPMILYKSALIRQNSGKSESYFIRIKEETLKKADIRPPANPNDEQDVNRQLSFYTKTQELKSKLNEGVSGFHQVQTNIELSERKIFKANFTKKLSTDFDKVQLSGVLAKDDDNISDLNKTVVNNGVNNANGVINNTKGVQVNLYLTPEDRIRLKPFFDNAVDGIAEIPESEISDILFRTNSSENPGTLLVNNNPIAKFCLENSFEQQCAELHTGIVDGEDNNHNAIDTSTVEINSNGAMTDADVPKFLSRLIKNVPSPDSVLNPVFNDQRPDRETIENEVRNFSLQKGPAEVPAFYDFHSLQIAFDHVWQQLIDTEMVNTADKLNRTFKAKFGVDWIDNVFNSKFPGKYDFPIYFSEIPAAVVANFDITQEEFNDLSPSLQNKLVDIANRIEAKYLTQVTGFGFSILIPADLKNAELTIQKFREQGEKIIDSVRHDDYYAMHKTLRDLQEKINSKYEFTVFAADKNFHSVNFGLVNTYRQKWVPLNYQAGELVKTIPLSPKEERKYSVKINRTEKLVSKEAQKNSSTIKNEMKSTTRAETDIIAKAQNKTNFSLSTEGTYNIGISKGKSTSTFGVEAQGESTNNRKDFHESVISAAQEYKSERSIEIDTEETTTYEYNESGTIVNPNDELSVTYLFYELQRKYRISEQLYRVMPVVLVAQEVPSPDQITDAWIIAHDWIINRFLLDDSFRPTLQYLATKSVGDDYALRELRKNLRQQRNLVEIMKIELMRANDEVTNRYRSLENAINKRIKEEEDEATDGWFSDVGDFFGGGGQSPEAAKARELAAKDAHQYAVERAEKMAQALQQETNNLHTLTQEYIKTMRDHLDYVTKCKRLIVHIRNNIFHYMQAIWTMEPPDQRFLRLHKVRVPKIELKKIVNDGVEIPDRKYKVRVTAEEDIFKDFRIPGTTKHKAVMSGNISPTEETVPLVEIADLDSLLGFKGNYMIFPMKEHNALTEFMAAPYIDRAFGAMDPDELSNINLEDFSKYVCCLHDKLPPEEFEAMKPELKKWHQLILADPLRNGDEIVVPTNSLFIEALPDVHPLLENFKLRHRELDVYKVQAEVRKMELENLRYASRLLANEREDPEIEKKIVLNGNIGTDIDINEN